MLIAVFGIQPLSYGNPATMDQAVQDYKAHRYGSCLVKLNVLLKEGKETDSVHYYRGLSYQNLNQIASAKNEYSWVCQNSQDERLRVNARKALQGLEKWSTHRAYSGNGNSFQRTGTPPLRRNMSPLTGIKPLPDPGGPRCGSGGCQ